MKLCIGLYKCNILPIYRYKQVFTSELNKRKTSMFTFFCLFNHLQDDALQAQLIKYLLYANHICEKVTTFVHSILHTLKYIKVASAAYL